MAEQIIQTLGFDAGKAISAIGNLNSALGNMTQSLLKASDAAKTFNGQNVSKALGKITRGAKGAEKALDRVAKRSSGINNVTKSLNKAGKASAGFNLSLQTLSRIVVAQGVVRGLNIIQGELREAISTAVDFNLALSEAAAISPRNLSTFSGEVSRLNAELIETSNAFGFDVLDLAEAKYQEFSNQVKGSADSTKLFTEANRLARISASSVGESVGAISSVLNSYDQDVTQADKVSAALFKTVELGRVRLKDIADQLGNVTPLAKSAGINFVELGASIATITRSGVSASRSLTQVRALINQLQKPPEELARLFKEVFQVRDIEQAIQKFGGLQGVIEAVADEAGGSTAKIARFFTNIRARNAFIALTSQSENLTNAITEIGEASATSETFLGDLLAEFDEQDAVKFQKAVQNVKNEFLELAQDALPVVTSALGLVAAGVDNMGLVFAAAAAGGVALLSVKLLAVAASATEAAVAANFAAAGVFGLAAAAGAGIGLLALFVTEAERVKGFADDFAQIDKIKTDKLRELATSSQDAAKEFAITTKAGLSLFSKLEAAGRRALVPIKAANDAFVSGIKFTLQDLVSQREKFVKALESQIAGLENRVTGRTEEAAGVREQIADNEFDRRQRNFSDLQKAFTRQSRAEKALKAIQKLPGDTQGLEAQAKGLERVKKLTEDAIAAADQSGNRTALFNAEKLRRDVLREQLSILNQQNKADEVATKAAKAKLKDERRKLEQTKEAAKALLASLSEFTPDGAVKTTEESAQSKRDAQKNLDKLQKLRFGADDFKLGDILGLADLQKQINETTDAISPQFTGVKDSLSRAIIEASSEVVAKIDVEFVVDQAALANIEIAVDPRDPTAGLRKGLEDTAAAEAALVSKQNEFNKSVIEADAVTAKLNQRLQSFRQTSEEANVVVFGGVFGDSQTKKAEANLKIVEAALKRLKEIIEAPTITTALQKEAANLVKTVNAAGDIPGGPGIFGENETKAQFDALLQQKRVIQESTQAQSEQLAVVKAARDAQEQALLFASTAKSNQDSITQSINASKTTQDNLNTEQGNSATLTKGIADGYDAASDSLVQLIAKQRELNAAQAAGNSQPKMFGGPVYRRHGGPLYRAAGGFVSRGTDTVPAMLSHGETVINARSSRRFASQINAMNAGVTPVYRAEGGVVNNSVSVGDINVNGTSDPDTTARRVMSQIRREERRGTSSRFKSR